MWTSTVVAGLAGAAFLALFYRSVRLRWPENYSTLQGALESYVSQGLWRYAGFRALPVFAIGVFVWVTVVRADGRPAVAVALMGAAHVAATNGRAMTRVLRRARPGENVAGLLLYYVLSSVLVATTCAGVIVTADRLRPLVPQTDKLSEAAWTGVFAAVLAVALQSLGRGDISDADLLDRARRDIGPDLWRQVRDAAGRYGTDGDLLRAIVAVEALQRPAWFRRAERLKGKPRGSGTYGVAQVSSSAPLSDSESIEELARRFQQFLPDRDESGYVLPERLAFALEK